MSTPQWPVAGEREYELIAQVLSGQMWGGFHPLVAQLERDFAAFQHCRFGISAFNGTITLEMALEALGIGPGDEVIVPAISFVSTATAVSRRGAIPVFVDIEFDTFNVDPQRIREAITPKTKAIIPVHFGGPMADMDSIIAIAAEFGLPLLEDAAHSHGSEWNGARAGSIGAVSSFSFQNGKVMTAGEGGMLLTNDAALATRLRALQNQGRKEGEGFFHHYTLGSNYRMTALQAAVLVAQLERLPAQNALRDRNARLIKESLADVPGLHFQVIPAAAAVHTNYLLLGWVDEDRDGFHQRLTAQGVPCTPFYPHTLQNNPLYLDRTNCRAMACPNAEGHIHDAFWLPHRALLGDEEESMRVASAIRAASAVPTATVHSNL